MWVSGEPLYSLLVNIGVPLRRWARLEVRGQDTLPPRGTAVLVVSNHDSMLDPLAVADTLMRAGRPVRFLTMQELWRLPLIGRILDGVGQIPLRRGAGDVDAMQAAHDALRDGEALCIFPEGGLSRGRRVRARSGVSRLIEAAPQAHVILAAVSGGTDLARFPRRPTVRVELFRAHEPARRDGENLAALAERLLAEIRIRVPPVPAGRNPQPPVPAPAAPAPRAPADSDDAAGTPAP
jgi:1-acyl-sn-glycerol-3-phosphate acyltransferase